MEWLRELFDRAPVLALFLSLAFGYAIGKIRVGSVSLGGICGTLLVAIALGQFDVTLSDDARNIAFATFIFALGFAAGPQFIANLDRRGLRLGIFTVIEVVCAVGLVLLWTAALGLDQGTAAGLLAGAATESAVVGTATDAIGNLNLDADRISTLQANVATAYTMSYLFGLIVIVLFTSQFAASLIRVDLRVEADRLWERLGGGAALKPGQAPAAPAIVGRVYEVHAAAGQTVAEVEGRLPGSAVLEHVRRQAEGLDATADLRLEVGDLVLVVGRREDVVGADEVVGPERSATDGVQVAMETRDVLVTQRAADRRTVADLREQGGADGHGVYVVAVTRADNTLPALPGTEVRLGDVTTLTGSPADLDRATRRLGRRVERTNTTDFVYLGVGVSLGILLGLPTLRLGEVGFSLGTGGGALLAGLLFGWFHARRPTFGNYPPAAAQYAKDLGLATFIAATGLSVGPKAGELIGKYGVLLPLAGITIVLVPALISLFVGHHLLHIEPPVLIGAIAGQQCSTPAISAVTEKAGNSTPMIGYTVTYALSNVLLPLTGPLVVVLAGAVT